MTRAQRKRLIEEKKKTTERKVRLWSNDQWHDLTVWRVPVTALLLNADNRRFKAEKQLLEQKLGRSLDPERSVEDERSVISILLDSAPTVDGDSIRGKPSKDYEALKRDWSKRKQENPFWIRPDGVVRNGNRRLALVKRLAETEGADGNEWVDAVILDPKEFDDAEVFEMEQREQLTEDFKVRYTDINLLLALREAAISHGIDWNDSESIEEVAGRLQGVAGGDQSYASIQLYAVRYMDAYLRHTNAAGQYQRLMRQVERFRDVGKVMRSMEKDYPNDAPDMLELAFAACSASAPHGEIRALKKLFLQDRQRFRKLVREVRAIEKELPEPELQEPNLAVLDKDEEDGDSEAEPPGPSLVNYPASEVRTRIQNSIDGLAASQNKNVASSLEQALNRLEAVSMEQLKSILVDAPVTQDIVKRICEWTEAAKKVLPKQKG